MQVDQVVRKEFDIEAAVVLQKSTKHVGFGPRPAVENPILGIFKGIKNVVEMNVDSRTQCGKDIEEDVVHVASDLRDMTGVDKEHISLAQLPEHLDRHILSSFCDDVEPARISAQRLQDLRIGVNEDALHGVLQKQLVRVQSHAGRKS